MKRVGVDLSLSLSACAAASSTMHKLRFKEPLQANGLSASELRGRLQTLHKELTEIGQGNLDTSQLDPYCQELIKPSFIRHKDKGVQAMVACNLADILRLYAPNAPFSQSEIKILFRFLLAQLVSPSTGLANAEHPLYKDAVYVLDSLSTVKSVVLVCDLPSASDLITEYFQKLWTLITGKLAKNVELAVIDVLIQLIDECITIPQAVVELLMNAYSQDPHTPTYMASTSICQATQDRLQKHVARYFSEAFLEVLERNEDEDEDDNVTALEQLHKQIVHVAEAAPSLLTSVVPQLESELQSDQVYVRLLATRALGTLFALPSNVSESFATLHSHVWKAWLGRAIDKHVPIRISWTEFAVKILTQHSELVSTITPILAARAVDPDEHVRSMLAELIYELDCDTIWHRIPLRILQELAQRGKDRRSTVRNRALDALGHAFFLAYAESGDVSTFTEKFGWIPGAVLNCHLTGSCDVTRSVVHTWETYIVPPDDPSYAQRLHTVTSLLNENERSILFYMSNLRLSRPTALDVYVECCDGKDSSRLPACIQAIAAILNDPDAPRVLHSFANAPDEFLLNAMRVCFDPSTLLDESARTRHEAVSYMEEQLPEMMDVLSECLWTGSFPILNVSCIQPLLELQSTQLLAFIAQHAPYLFKGYSEILMQMVLDEPVSSLAFDLLASLAAFDAASFTVSESFIAYLTKQASKSYAAAKLISCISPDVVTQQVTFIQEQLEHESNDASADALEALAAFLEYSPVEHIPSLNTLMEHILHRIVLAPWPDHQHELDMEWIDDKCMPLPLRTRLSSLRVLTQWCFVQKKVELLPPVLKLLWILLGTGEVHHDQHIPPGVRARVRLYAAQCILKLATCDAYASLILPRMGRLSYALQDECFQVRTRLLHDLLLYLRRDELPSEFHAIVFLVAFDPEDEPRVQVASYTRRLHVLPPSVRHERLERIIVRFLHLLAHHPDLNADSPQTLCSFLRYLDFYLACVACENNISVLAHFTACVRTFIDLSGSDPSVESSRSLYAMAELAQFSIQRLADINGWSIYPVEEEAPCPKDILKSTGTMAPGVLDEQAWELLQQQPRRTRDKKTKIA